MMQNIKRYIVAGMLIAGFGGALLSTVPQETVSAACGSFLSFPPWYDGLVDGSCEMKSVDEVGGLQKYIWTIVFNVVEIMLQVVAYAAGFFVLYGGFLYLTSSGAPDQAAKALKTILNALIGMVIAIGAVFIVNILSRVITG